METSRGSQGGGEQIGQAEKLHADLLALMAESYEADLDRKRGDGEAFIAIVDRNKEPREVAGHVLFGGGSVFVERSLLRDTEEEGRTTANAWLVATFVSKTFKFTDSQLGPIDFCKIMSDPLNGVVAYPSNYPHMKEGLRVPEETMQEIAEEIAITYPSTVRSGA